MRTLQQKTFDLIHDGHGKSKAGHVFDGAIVTLIIVNVICVILDTFNMPEWYAQVSAIIEIISVAVFTIEYILRVWVAPLYHPEMKPWRARVKYMLSAMALIDLLAVIPFYISIFPIDLRVLRALRIIRLFRIFKVNRYINAMANIAEVFRKKSHQLISSLLVVFLLMLMASVIMVNVENTAQPDVFENAFSGMLWSMAALTSVWYGDIYPVTTLGRILSSVIAILGVGIIAVPTGIISAGFVEICGQEHEENSHHPLSVADEIRKSHALLSDGIINESEFEAIKGKYIYGDEEKN